MCTAGTVGRADEHGQSRAYSTLMAAAYRQAAEAAQATFVELEALRPPPGLVIRHRAATDDLGRRLDGIRGRCPPFRDPGRVATAVVELLTTRRLLCDAIETFEGHRGGLTGSEEPWSWGTRAPDGSLAPT